MLLDTVTMVIRCSSGNAYFFITLAKYFSLIEVAHRIILVFFFLVNKREEDLYDQLLKEMISANERTR